MANNFNNLKYFIYHVGKEVAKSPCKTLRYSSAGIYCSASGGCNHKLFFVYLQSVVSLNVTHRRELRNVRAVSDDNIKVHICRYTDYIMRT